MGISEDMQFRIERRLTADGVPRLLEASTKEEASRGYAFSQETALSELIRDAYALLQLRPAEKDFQRALNRIPDNCPEKHYLKAVFCLAGSTDHVIPDEARQSLEKALELDPGNRFYNAVADLLRASYDTAEGDAEQRRDRLQRAHDRLRRRVSSRL